MIVTVNTDGGSRGNPGQAAIGVVVSDEMSVIAELKQAIGVATNNEAEYTAVIY
jgi:ribonuclease HI